MDDFFDSHEARDAKVRADNARDAKAAKDAEASAEAALKAGTDKEVPAKEALVDAPPLVSSAPKSSAAADDDDSDAPDDASDDGEADDSADSDDDTPQPRPKRVPKRKTRGFVEVKKPDKGKKTSSPAKKTRDDIDDDEDADDRNRKTRDNRKKSLESQICENQLRDQRDRDKKRDRDDEAEEFDEDYEDPDYDDKFAIRIFDAEDQNFIQKYFSFVQGVLFNPKKFFAAMPPEGLMAPTIFLGISAGIYAFFQAFGRMNPIVLFTSFFSSMILTASGAVVVWALFNKACKGHGTFAQTYKVLAYSKATLLFAWIVAGTMPLGGYLSVAYTLFLNYIGLKKVHRLNTFMTAGIVLLLGVLAMELKKMLPF